MYNSFILQLYTFRRETLRNYLVRDYLIKKELLGCLILLLYYIHNKKTDFFKDILFTTVTIIEAFTLINDYYTILFLTTNTLFNTLFENNR